MQQEKILELKESIISLANDVEAMLSNAIEGFLEKDEKKLKNIIDTEEKKIHKKEIKIDKLYTRILALYHAEAKDLRTILMVSKMNSDLERVADQCVNIAESALYLIDKTSVKPYIDIPRMAEITKTMLTESVNSFINEDAVLAENVCERDEEVDSLNEQIFRELLTFMISDPKTIERSMHLIRIANNIEKIADLSTNIAEETVFLVTGKIIKHNRLSKEK